MGWRLRSMVEEEDERSRALSGVMRGVRNGR